MRRELRTTPAEQQEEYHHLPAIVGDPSPDWSDFDLCMHSQAVNRRTRPLVHSYPSFMPMALYR